VLRINTNVAAINTLRQTRLADSGVSKALERLSSGLRVNRASDDAAGLSISEALRSQVRGNARATKNIQDGISLINVADGALNEIHDVLQRMRQLAVQASNGTLTASDRAATEQEFAALQAEIGNIASNTSFNGMQLFIGQAGTFTTGLTPNGTATAPSTAGTTTLTLPGPPGFSPSSLNGTPTVTAQDTTPIAPGPPPVFNPPQTLNFPADFSINQTLVGYNGTTPLYQYSLTINNASLVGAGPFNLTASGINMTWPTSNLPLQVTLQSGANYNQTDVVSINPVNLGAMGVGASNLSTLPGAQGAISNCDAALSYISTARGRLGATSNAIEHALNSQMIAHENQSASESRIRDADMADSMMDLTRQQILMQSSMSMLSIANDSRTIMGLFNG
jgi:flagellin